MRCLTPAEVEKLFGPAGFRVSFAHPDYRIALYLDRTVFSRHVRIGGRPREDVVGLPYFAVALDQWLPPNRHRLLWVDHWEWAFPHIYSTFLAVRKGLGDARSLSEAPGHYFDLFPWDEQDQLEISPEQATETDYLIGLMSLIMIGRWDAWLIADSSADMIEFWEGNLFFHSADKAQIAAAEALMVDCPRDLR